MAKVNVINPLPVTHLTPNLPLFFFCLSDNTLPSDPPLARGLQAGAAGEEGRSLGGQRAGSGGALRLWRSSGGSRGRPLALLFLLLIGQQAGDADT